MATSTVDRKARDAELLLSADGVAPIQVEPGKVCGRAGCGELAGWLVRWSAGSGRYRYVPRCTRDAARRLRRWDLSSWRSTVDQRVNRIRVANPGTPRIYWACLRREMEARDEIRRLTCEAARLAGKYRWRAEHDPAGLAEVVGDLRALAGLTGGEPR